MTYKKLFTITYNNKDFMLFLDENNRKTFLEINDSGEYEYPNLEDFIALNKIYNYNNPFICYNIPKFTFKECAKQVKNGVLSLLTVLTLINSIPSALAGEVKYEVNDESVVLSNTGLIPVTTKLIPIDDSKDISKYLGEIDLTPELIIYTINNNNKIPDDVKQIAIEEFQEFYQKYPNADYRVFYENVKVLEVNIYSDEEYKEKFWDSPGSSANFDSMNHCISLKNGYNKSIVRHEFAHTYSVLWLEKDDFVVIKFDDNTALQEGATDDITNKNDSSASYQTSKQVYKYLKDISGYTFEEYIRFGTSKMITKLSEMYPDVDIKYIAEYLDALVSSEIHDNVEMQEDCYYAYDELFEICLKTITPDSGYTPYLKFAALLNNIKDKSIIIKYFDRYNEELNKIGYHHQDSKKIQENIKIYEKSNIILYNNEGFYFGYVDKDNNMFRITSDGQSYPVQSYSGIIPINFEALKIKAIIEYPNNISEGIKNGIIEQNAISAFWIIDIPIYLNGKLLTTTKIDYLNIAVGQTHDNKVGYVIRDNDKVIYETEPNLQNLSPLISMSSYLMNFSEYENKSLELSSVLNDNFLKEYQNMTKAFPNIEFLDSEINFKKIDLTNIPEAEQESVITIFKDNKILGEYILEDMFITIGSTPDKKLGYTIIDKQGNIIYKSNPEITEESNPVNFSDFVGKIDKLELNDILNENYLRTFQQKTNAFYNLEIVGEKIIVDATPTITIRSKVNEKEIRQTYKISKCRVYIGNGSYSISGSSIIPDGFSYEQSISIEELLDYNGMLDNGIPTFLMTYDELNELVNNYLKDTNEKGR